MKILADARVAIGIEPTVGQIRFYDGLPAPGAERPPYVATATYIHLSPTELLICAFAGRSVTRAHLVLIARWALGQGYLHLYAARPPGHTLPLAHRRTQRPLLGWFEIDLQHAAAIFQEPSCADPV